MSNEAVEGLEEAIALFDKGVSWVRSNDELLKWSQNHNKILQAARLQLTRQQSAQRDSSDTAQSTGAIDMQKLGIALRKIPTCRSTNERFIVESAASAFYYGNGVPVINDRDIDIDDGETEGWLWQALQDDRCSQSFAAEVRERLEGKLDYLASQKIIGGGWKLIDADTPKDTEIMVASFYYDGSCECLFRTKISEHDYKPKSGMFYLMPRDLKCGNCGDTPQRELVTHWADLPSPPASTSKQEK